MAVMNRHLVKQIGIPATMLVIALCAFAGYVVLSHAVVYVRGPIVAGAKVPPAAATSSRFSYSAAVVGYDETGAHTTSFDAIPDFVFAVFGGHLLGADRGEWGGEMVFRDSGGAIHRLIDRNVRGIVRMPFGVIVFTGLAHLSQSTGAIYRVDQRPDGVVMATLFHTLPGTPEDIRWTTHGDLVFRVVIDDAHPGGLFHFRERRTRCLRLDRLGVIQNQLCLAIIDRSRTPGN